MGTKKRIEEEEKEMCHADMETADAIPLETDNFYCEYEIESFSHSINSLLLIIS